MKLSKELVAASAGTPAVRVRAQVHAPSRSMSNMFARICTQLRLPPVPSHLFAVVQAEWSAGVAAINEQLLTVSQARSKAEDDNMLLREKLLAAQVCTRHDNLARMCHLACHVTTDATLYHAPPIAEHGETQ